MNTLKKSILKTDVNLLNGPIFRSLIIFAIPLLISNIFQQLYNTVDTILCLHVHLFYLDA